MANNHSESKTPVGVSRRASGKLEAEVVENICAGAGADLFAYADHKFAIAEKELAGKGTGRR